MKEEKGNRKEPKGRKNLERARRLDIFGFNFGGGFQDLIILCREIPLESDRATG